MSKRLAPRNGNEAAAWLKEQRQERADWYRRCLQLQRTARGIPALAPTAYAASQLTPTGERVHQISSLRRGMIGYGKGPDPAGHIYYILGRRPGASLSDPNGVLTEGNDVVSGHKGAIGIVSLAYYTKYWGHEFLFGATWLNGYDFADFNAKPKPTHPTLGKNYEEAIEAMERAIHAHRHHPKLQASLRDDLAAMKRKYKKYSKKH